MFALFINPKDQMPTAVSLNSRHYLELQLAGYSEVLTGSRKNMLDKQKELLDELGLTDLDMDIQQD